MEEVITTLEREFKRVYLDIEYVSHRLDIDTSRTRNDNIPDVGSFMKRLNELENKLVSITDRTDKVTLKREELFNNVIDILNDNHKALTNITNSMSGFKVDDVNSFNEAKTDLSKALDNTLFFNASMIQNTNSNDKVENDENTIPNNNNIPPTKLSTITTTTDKLKNKVVEPITKEKFEAIPLSIRGRCQLEQVVTVLHKLQSNKMSKSSPISLAELDSSGKLTGKTGDSIIATLKALGLITKTRDGITLVKTK